MLNKLFVSAAALAALLATASVVVAETGAAPASCIFETYGPRAVNPYKVEESVGYGSITVLRGAQLYVPAREGLTKEWLALSVKRALAAPADMQKRSCRPDVRDVSVSVDSAGTGFWVNLGSRDPESARALLRWAQTELAQKSQTAAAR
jgi:hypothetical protein